MEVLRSRPTAKQIHPASAQATVAGSRQEKPKAPLFDETMHLVQKNGKPLDFIDDHYTVP
jgi:hypothetical protein